MTTLKIVAAGCSETFISITQKITIKIFTAAITSNLIILLTDLILGYFLILVARVGSHPEPFEY